MVLGRICGKMASMNATQNPSREELKSEIQILRNENLHLKEQLAWFQRQYFGKRTERIVKALDNHVQLLPGFEEYFQNQDNQESKQQEQKIPSHTRRVSKDKGHDKISVPDDLPVQRIEIDLSEEEKKCAETGLPLVKIGEEVSRKLAHIPESFYVKEYVRPIYAMPKNSQGSILIAELPDSIIPKCRADESFLAEIITKKFADHLPLYRIVESLSRIDISISKQILSQWVVRLGFALKPLYNLMTEKILKSGNIFVDETPIDMLVPGKGKTHQAYMWVIAGGNDRDPANRVYHFKENRKHEHALELIGDYSGVLHSDKYGAYEKLAAQKKIIWTPCWSHIRRKFFEAESGDLEFRNWMLRKIRYLFMFERVAWNRSPEERLAIRKEKEEPIINELISAVKKRLAEGRILPKSKFKEALGYFCGLIPFLKNYLYHAWARIDNNVAERAIRPLAIGRKNWMFVGSKDGGIAAAVLFSLVQTCRGLGINPREYLEDVFRRIMSHPYNRLDELLPENWTKSR